MGQHGILIHSLYFELIGWNSNCTGGWEIEFISVFKENRIWINLYQLQKHVFV